MAVAPLLKGTGYELYPPAAVALIFATMRRHGRVEVLSLGAVAATIVLIQFGWSELAPVFHRTIFTTPGGGTPGVGLEAFHKPKTYISWMLRFMFPFKLPLVNHDWTVVNWPFFNVYIERGFASFGWYAIEFPKWVYLIITATLGVAFVLGIKAMWAVPGVLKRRWPEILFLALVPVTVICAVEASFEPILAILPLTGTPEEGRYAFPAIAAGSVLLIGCCFGLGRKRAPYLAAFGVSALIGLTVASQILTLSTYYT
jgi:hypothetical protein